MALLTHDDDYYSVGISKLRKDQIHLLEDDLYLSMKKMEEIYCFANNKKVFDGFFSIDSGICLGYIVIDLVRRIAHLEKIENPEKYTRDEVDFLHYNPKLEYINDLDSIKDTDEYKNPVLRLYNDLFSNTIKRIGGLARRLLK